MAGTRGTGPGSDGGHLGAGRSSDAGSVPELDPLRRRAGRGTSVPPARGSGLLDPSGGAGGPSGRAGAFAPSRGCAGAVRAAPRRFAILRVAKLKTMGNLHGAAQHHLRERHTPNADPARLDLNEILIGADTAQGIAEDWRRVAPERFRKDAVRAVEYFIGASPEAMGAMSRDDQDLYLRRSLAWIEERHAPGSVISAIVHRDETTPHLSALVVPVDPETGNLNAKRWTGGKAALSAMQTDFAASVAAWGLERGQERSLARHQSIREYYAQIKADAALSASPVPELDLPARGAAGGLSGAIGRKEPIDAYADRLRAEAEARVAELQRQLAAERQASRNLERQAERGRALLIQADARAADRSLLTASQRLEREAHRSLRDVECMEPGAEQRALFAELGAKLDETAAAGVLDPEAHLHFARILDEWDQATPMMTAALKAHANERATERTLGEDDGWSL